ncbi:Endoplasmic reticulum mannosyl-oligosaccharide 1,2-alpha-mannosidase [Trichinella pseudospiralis]|uniref:alpha-1,2-Mannosidase n=2 Tax=Trichinella pseudospiralis TaxID=6337 RepID=A0A0V1E4R7_TRIPS|nr:Endoplasmic reticulum mannosyl-oligosaccharide 1,2-alpha-mannosidase [Trichinella pseudospiralis]KRY68829.1 Endoplasmic reticulum mannosyl-oligosaccharide 1,2-alpha-mannosidase [Trichinella pseudospiralis]KRY87126.1 Endoplasmic reticulum mannosyl-oligosaccharide 1,2-alpha-mannosidase [Trichinella pseudospiralis]KRZ27273.1 Endoplasmic reticulum mannosyl-oligosaccharide 1,2-alpha-mannosidase [Trichinella pseudospiralis]KRZ39865.1 Endoplasmic reticulum mannosyl-oligosaccharide 1,2-alpha-mannosi
MHVPLIIDIDENLGNIQKQRRLKTAFSRNWRRIPRILRFLLIIIGIFSTCSAALLYLHRLTADEDVAVDVKARPVISMSYEHKGKRAVHFNGPSNERQRAVVNAFRHAWDAYKKYAFGSDMLDPVNGKPAKEWFGLQLTLVDSLDTMLIMGLNEEFTAIRNQFSTFTADVDRFVSLFEVTIRILGGLLSVYRLTDDDLFLEKAKELGDRLMPAFSTKSGIPYSDVNLHTGEGRNPPWMSLSSLSEVASLQLEFRELSRATNDSKYELAAFKVSTNIHNQQQCKKYAGLCPMFINVDTGKFVKEGRITLGARTDSYYEYLLKQWLQTGKKINWLKDDFLKSMSGVTKLLFRRSKSRKLAFVGELLENSSFSPKMDHLVCFLPGLLALAVHHGLNQMLLEMAKSVATTCYEFYTANPLGLGPEIVYFNVNDLSSKPDIEIKQADSHSLLRPEAIESWFYLYRITKDPIYQDWGWQVFQAIEKHAKQVNGYCSVRSVLVEEAECIEKMESFFLAETLKYLYLLFDDENSTLTLDEYVFNTEGHPLPIYHQY